MRVTYPGSSIGSPITAPSNKPLSVKERYAPKAIYYWGNVSFTLSQPNPTEEESRLVLLKIVEQAIRDFVNLSNSKSPGEEWAYKTAEAFLFEEEYRIDYGGVEYSLNEILAILGLDIEWIRRKTTELERQRSLDKSLKATPSSTEDIEEEEE